MLKTLDFPRLDYSGHPLPSSNLLRSLPECMHMILEPTNLIQLRNDGIRTTSGLTSEIMLHSITVNSFNQSDSKEP